MGNPCNDMADPRPHILVVGGTEYCLGSFDGKRIEYDFSKVLAYLDAKGRSLFGESFKIRDGDKGTFLKLCSYMVKDIESCRKMERYIVDRTGGMWQDEHDAVGTPPCPA